MVTSLTTTTTLDSLFGDKLKAKFWGEKDTRIEIEVEKRDDETSYTVSFPENEYYKDRFFSILGLISPWDRPQQQFDVYADWLIGSKDRELNDMHQTLQPHWGEFIGNYRDLFMNALDPRAPTPEGMIQKFYRKFGRKVRSMDSIIKEAREEGPGRPSIFKRMYASVRDGRIPRSRELKKMHRKKKREIIEEALDTEAGKHALAQRAMRVDGMALIYNKEGIQYIRRVEGFDVDIEGMRVTLRERGYEVEMLIKEGVPRVVSGPNSRGLKLFMKWTKDHENKREYDFSVPDNRYNPLLGFIYAAAFRDDAKTLFPKQIGLPGRVNKQLMREAQTPLLALMSRERLVDSPFYDAIEKFTSDL